MALEVQAHLDRDWNVGDHAREISSVLSAGRYEARVHDGWPPLAFPAERPRYEWPEPLGSPILPTVRSSVPSRPSPAPSDTLPSIVRKSRSKRKMSSAPAAPLVDASHTTDGWKSLDTEHPT